MSRDFLRRPLRGIFSVFVLTFLVLCMGLPHLAVAQGERGASPGDFDYYILALSWSPTFCNSRGGGEREDYDGGDRGGYGSGRGGYRQGYGRSDSGEQCSGARPYAFVLHGLWPQYERKGWPEFCQTGGRPWVPGETIDRMLDIMPSRHLVIQEYKKHGVCSGLDPQAYFDQARKAYGNVRIPAQFQEPGAPLKLAPEDIQRAFAEANSQLSANSIQVVCSKDSLSEVRICLGKDLSPRPCSRSGQERRTCYYNAVTVPPVRHGGTGRNEGRD
jgi:ribonuclease T2